MKGGSVSKDGSAICSIDFEVTPHQLRHTYIANLLMAGVDVKTVQVLAGHENAKITLDIRVRLMYNQSEDLQYNLRDEIMKTGHKVIPL